jgi:putative nucleotidyltransferase with HDIG domain
MIVKKDFHWKKTKAQILQIGLRAVLGLVVASCTIATVYIGRKPYGEELKEGDVSLRAIYAPLDFKYRVGIDQSKTDLEREKAAQAVNQVYYIDRQINERLLNRVNKLYTQIIAVQNLTELSEEEKLQRAKQLLEISTSEADLKTFLAESNLEKARDKTMTLLKDTLNQGIITTKLEKKLIKTDQEHIVLKNLDAQEEARILIAELYTEDVVKKNTVNNLQGLFPENRKLRIAVINLLEKTIRPNLEFNEKLTKQRRKIAYDNAPLQYKEKGVKKDELIISRGERVAKEHLLKIKEMFRRQERVNRFMFFSGAVILTLIFLGIISIYLKSYQPKIFFSIRKLTLIVTLFVLILGLAKAITYSPLPSYVIPTAIASILIAMLIGFRLAILITIILSIFVGIIAGDKLNVACVSFIGGIVGIFFIQDARRRSQILFTGCAVGLANFICICALELLHGLKYTVFLMQGFWGIINGLGVAVIVTGILPVFEYMFNLVTNISLLELSDLNHPLLKEMVIKAPGTYHHSLIVGNLSEAACEAIGANSLLARVGSYFHDIGKIEKAEYFSENQTGIAKKKHDKLTPSMSSLIITNHVKDGLDLGRKYKLNRAIFNFIEQHHGTSLIYYFYQRALEKIEDEQILKEEGFRYPGPKPQTKEAAVVLLADSVEAASRTLSDPTPARIKGLVRKIINNKFIDNQLDQCELTLKDLEAIAEIFSRILMGIFHSRVEYEEANKKIQTEGKNKQYPEKNNNK